MLLDLREYVRNSKPVKYTLITVISIPFVLFGIGSYFSGGGANYAAVIDGEEIGVREYEIAYNQQTQQLRQMFGGQIPEGFAAEPQIRQQALESLLTQQALRNIVNESGFTVSDDSLAQAIQDIDGFQVDGQFDPERYRAQLISSGMSVDQFEQSFRNDTAMAQFRAGIVETAFELSNEQSRLNQLSSQERHIDSILLPIEEKAEAVEVSDEDVQAHFDENAESYKFPQRVKIEYVTLDIDDLSSAVEITDEDAQAHYDSNTSSYLVPEERKASHILLKPEQGNEEELAAAKQQLLDIKGRVEAGEDFAEIAKEVSKDLGSAKNGGSLGQFGRGAMVPPFEEAVFGMTEIGSLSEPVESDFGVHLILLEGIIEEHGAAFADVKDEIVAQLQRNQADTEYGDLLEILTEESFDNADSLESAADATGLEIKTSEWIDGTEDSDPNPQLANPVILRTALSEDVLLEGNNSEVLSIGDKQNIVLRVLEHEEPRAKTIDDVREDIIDTIKQERAAEQLDSELSELKELIEAGQDPSATVEELGGTLNQEQVITRTSTDLDPAIVQSLFTLPRPQAESPVLDENVLANGDRVLVILKNVVVPEESESESEEGETASPQNRGALIGNAEFTSLLRNLRASADVEVNEQLLNQY